ncbi:MAG: CvpA family protein [Bacteroidota bacterium]
MIIDLMIIFPVITLCVLGFRDGIVKKGIALLVTFAALISAQLLMSDVADFYVEEFDLERGEAVIYGFYSVFFGLIFLQSLIYRLTASEYKIGGIADRFVGSGLGLLQGLLIMSVIFMMLALRGFPSRQYRVDSRLYKPILNIAPQVLDFTLETVPEATEDLRGETKERLDEFTKPDTPAPAQKQNPAQKK